MESSESDDLFRFFEWADTHKRKLVGAAAIIAGVAAIIAFINWKKGQDEIKANDAVFNLPSLIAGPGNSTPSSADYLKVGDSHSSTQAGERAFLLGAGLLFTEGKYADAQAAFDKFLKDHTDSPFRPEADFGVAASLEAQGKTSDAMIQYEQVSNRYVNDAAGIQARLSVGRLAENAKNFDKAFKAYTDVSKMIQSPFSQEARSRMELLVSKHPELVKTNAPTALPSTTPAPAK